MKIPQRSLTIASFYFQPGISHQWPVASFSAALNTQAKNAVGRKPDAPPRCRKVTLSLLQQDRSLLACLLSFTEFKLDTTLDNVS